MSYSFANLATKLNPTRMRYPYFIGAALWIGWVISLLLGSGNTDAAGHLIGTDFVAFYTSGKILLSEPSSNLYDLELAQHIQQPLYPESSDNFNPYLNPPFYAFLFIPFALFPYPFSPILWMSINLFLHWLGLKFLQPIRTFPIYLLTLTWQPAFAAVSFGQNAFLSLFFLCFTFILWKKEKYFMAGLVIGLLLYKPQLLVGVLLLWILDFSKSWRALIGFGLTSLILLSLSFLILPEATVEYFVFTQKIASNLMNVEGFPIWNAHSVQSFWLAILPEVTNLTKGLYFISALMGLWLFLRFFRSTKNQTLRYGAAICLTVWVTPYIMVYDWVLLIIPAVLFWQESAVVRNELKVIYALIWVVMFFSSALTFLQWSYLGRAIQISIPLLLVALYLCYKIIPRNKAESTLLPSE